LVLTDRDGWLVGSNVSRGIMSKSNGFRAPFNVVAAFSDEGDASVAVDALTTRGVPLPAITTHRPDEGEETGDDVAAAGSQAKTSLVAALTLGLLGSGRKRRRGQEPRPDTGPTAQRDVLVALHLCDSEQAERTAALLRGLGAERVDLFDARGTRISISERRET
jgi:hypothetical protein